jgi:phosphate transport system protein
MSKHIEREIARLKGLVYRLSTLVEESVSRAVKAVDERDASMALTVIESDESVIDTMEVEVEEECLKVLALHQPVAIDLRIVIAILKLNNDLERIGDLAVNIAHRAVSLTSQAELKSDLDIHGMALKVKVMLHNSLDSLVNLDQPLAEKVCRSDDEIDDLNREMHQKIKKHISKHPEHIEQMLNMLIISRNLERIGDHATNIAEDVLYMLQGEIRRHGR